MIIKDVLIVTIYFNNNKIYNISDKWWTIQANLSYSCLIEVNLTSSKQCIFMALFKRLNERFFQLLFFLWTNANFVTTSVYPVDFECLLPLIRSQKEFPWKQPLVEVLNYGFFSFNFI